MTTQYEAVIFNFLKATDRRSIKIHVFCNGCPENRLDVARAEKYFQQNGFSVTDDWRSADLILFNACGRSHKTAAHSVKLMEEIKEKKTTNQQLIVWGCLPKIEIQAMTEFKDLVALGPNLELLNTAVDSPISFKTVYSNHLGKCLQPKIRKTTILWYEIFLNNLLFNKTVIAWLNYLEGHFNLVQKASTFYIGTGTGCRSKCAYCAINKSRGLLKSKPIENILSEFREGRKLKYNSFSLMGTDVAAYGLDLGYSIVDLLSELIKEEGDFKINLRNLNPYHVIQHIEQLIPIFESGKINYLEIAAESGSNHVLELMNRNYSIEQYCDCVRKIKKASPNIILRTQLIAGFPGETEQDFLDSIALINKVAFDYIEVYEFSLRKGTIAETIEPKVPPEIVRRRYITLCRKALFNRTPQKIKKIIANKIIS
jgi:tRNA A37 methylthiotransferase MiaB